MMVMSWEELVNHVKVHRLVKLLVEVLDLHRLIAKNVLKELILIMTPQLAILVLLFKIVHPVLIMQHVQLV